MPDMIPEFICRSCERDVEEDGATRVDCAAGRFGTDDPDCCEDCGGCFCDGAC